MAREVAQKVTIDRRRKIVLIDGVEFPYFLAEHGPDVENVCSSLGLPIISLPVIAYEVEVIPDEPDGEGA